jgi:cullin 1
MTIERNYTIRATIGRIMNAREILKHALLIREVIQQLSSRFQPKVSIIKVNLI